MAKVSRVKKIIDFIAEKNPELLEEEMNVGHDIMYLPIPTDCTQEELNQLLTECGAFIDEDSITLFI